MRFQTVQDVLDWVEAFHQQLRADYAALSAQARDERVKMLLDYLADHEERLAAALDQYEGDAPDKVLETWYDKALDFPLPVGVDDLKQAMQALTVNEVIEQAAQCHDALIDLYQLLAREADVPETQELFDNLAQLERNEKMRAVRDSVRLQDL